MPVFTPSMLIKRVRGHHKRTRLIDRPEIEGKTALTEFPVNTSEVTMASFMGYLSLLKTSDTLAQTVPIHRSFAARAVFPS